MSSRTPVYAATTCLIFCLIPGLCKRSKPIGAAYRRLKANREENLTKCAGSIYAYVKKAEKIGSVMMRKVAASRKSKTHNQQ